MNDAASMPNRLFAVGDIHGRYERLARLLDLLPFDPASDAVVFLGDYVNRGPDSRRVIDRLLELESRCPRAVFLLGNHERALLEYARTGDQALFQALRGWGVEATLASYGRKSMHSLRDLSFLPAGHLAFLRRLRLFHREAGYLFVHAGVTPGVQPEDNRPDALLDIRELFLHEPTGLDELVVFGHTPFESPLVLEDRVGLDTGAGHGGQLTAAELAVAPGVPRGALRFFHA